jgi:hypothetical protein
VSEATPTPEPASASADVERVIHERVAAVIAERDAAAEQLRLRQVQKERIVDDILGGKRDLMELLPDTDDVQAIEAFATKLRSRFMQQIVPDVGGTGRDGGRPTSQQGRSLGGLPTSLLLSQALYRQR